MNQYNITNILRIDCSCSLSIHFYRKIYTNTCIPIVNNTELLFIINKLMHCNCVMNNVLCPK